jgi:uncharacterized RDD family membrane protein YckC
MKCPKCGYIGFETSERCRNCGYEFSLATTKPLSSELPIRTADDSGGPPSDLALAPRDREEAVTKAHAGQPLDLDRIIGAPEVKTDLPLFAGNGPDPVAEDLPPLVTPRATPRRPLSVRRPTPDPSRLRARPEPRERAATLDLPLPPAGEGRATPRPGETRRPADEAGALSRIAAAIVDLALLGAIDVLTVYFTLRICGLSVADWRVLPLVPLGVFFLLLNGGYLVAFTAGGGQTIGKMTFGLKVIGTNNAPVPIGVATIRALGCLASVLCLGAGLLPALTGGRAVHDRLADTRVVRLSA